MIVGKPQVHLQAAVHLVHEVHDRPLTARKGDRGSAHSVGWTSTLACTSTASTVGPGKSPATSFTLSHYLSGSATEIPGARRSRAGREQRPVEAPGHRDPAQLLPRVPVQAPWSVRRLALLSSLLQSYGKGTGA